MNCYSSLNNILLSLEFQKNSLVHVEFTSTNFNNVSLKNLKGLYNLKYLRFENCEGILLDQCEVLNITSFKLMKLSLKRNNWIVDVTSFMIKYLGASLQRLLVDNPTIPLIENVLMFCSKLIFLKIRINYHFDLSVLPFFKNLRIRILNINITSYNPNNINEFFINLANNIPTNISNISIYIYSRNSNKFLRFKEFLENCHNDFKIINLNHIVELEFLKIVLKYIERSNNNLKIFGMLGLDKEFNDEELNLLNQIKDKGNI
uniref:RNI-like protein n=1 Tax=Rhizophagus irregularis (strain DAOM 181602 / DAOM 197198 / MUCL 43194) TaxID=747089 RepID=U9SUW6_RHIID